MNKVVVNAKLGWLSLNLANRRNNIAAVLLRLRGFGAQVGASLGFQKKVWRLLDQVAFEREREVEILNEIEDVERLHLHFKKQKMLRHVVPEKNPARSVIPIERHVPKRSGLVALFGLLWLLSPRPKPHKKQDLTVD